jgi:hypothetical protein
VLTSITVRAGAGDAVGVRGVHHLGDHRHQHLHVGQGVGVGEEAASLGGEGDPGNDVGTGGVEGGTDELLGFAVRVDVEGVGERVILGREAPHAVRRVVEAVAIVVERQAVHRQQYGDANTA